MKWLLLFLLACKPEITRLPDNLFVISPEEGALQGPEDKLSCHDPDAVYYVCMHIDDLIALKRKIDLECTK